MPVDWYAQLEPFFESDDWTKLVARLDACTDVTVFPPRQEIFEAFVQTPYQSVKVVILGQDPYHNDGQAHGLSFSVKEGVKTPPSLRNIFKEIGGPKPPNGNLERWTSQGVLLLNTTLTVEAHKANSHRKFGWQKLTDLVIEKLNDREEPVVFMLWGNAARKKASLITNERHLVLQSAHPSPLSASRGFFGNGHFEAANKYWKNIGKATVDWKFNPKPELEADQSTAE
ncbi:MAG: uracil-DNA glycosylase [Rickettsiales bacterium]|nr:uracil-DNA glycosylase [Rickettsiales bacterium]